MTNEVVIARAGTRIAAESAPRPAGDHGLADAEVGDFTELETVLEAARGQLSILLEKLEEAGCVAIDKSPVDRKLLTRDRITDTGRDPVQTYVKAIGALIGEPG